VILAVDSSYLTCGWILFQLDTEGHHHPAHFGSITWNDCESRYSQAKIELYGLFRALRAGKVWLIGLKHFTVEVNAKYIRGMLNNPDIQPNAAVNHWIMGISLFDFTLRHVPGDKHVVPDGLSRRHSAPEDKQNLEETSEDVEEWIDEILECGIWTAKEFDNEQSPSHNAFVYKAENIAHRPDPDIPSMETSLHLNNELHAIQNYLETFTFPPNIPSTSHHRLCKHALQFFIQGHQLWRKEPNGHHQLILFNSDRLRMMQEAHDLLGHKGFYSTRCTISDHFWWPSLNKDLSWYLKTCHQCQIQSIEKVIIPPTISVLTTLFQKAYTDTMFMPTSHGYNRIVQAHCSLSSWLEWQMLKTETARTLGAFLFEEVLCRWGVIEEIVTDNRAPFIAAVDWLVQKYGIYHIRVSAYNSQANGIVECSHRTTTTLSSKHAMVTSHYGQKSPLTCFGQTELLHEDPLDTRLITLLTV
jgi:hypothetical protein